MAIKRLASEFEVTAARVDGRSVKGRIIPVVYSLLSGKREYAAGPNDCFHRCDHISNGGGVGLAFILTRLDQRSV